MFGKPAQTPNLTLYFLDSNSSLRQLQTSDPSDPYWTPGSFDNTIKVPDNSHLATYSCQHPSYLDRSDAWFQGSEGYFDAFDSKGLTRVDNNDVAAGKSITIHKPPVNSSLALVPHYIYDYNRTAKAPWVSLFFVDSNVLWQYHYHKNGKLDFMRHFDSDDDPRLPDNTNMAGFSWGYNEMIPNVGGLQVLYTMPDADGAGGIGLLQMNKIADEGEWQSIDAANSSNPFKSVARS
ncbi:hypothetical protein UCDDS831_g06618 [Diplodia seriata]|uniref:Uncharacterized protein n=1 Tax=Diplodia seriata TaxID=420778 RepID=A0A0G2FZI6_9PEZI|nr:hypothetical protein UCDDS831_g06618 [Diplodia seriata]